MKKARSRWERGTITAMKQRARFVGPVAVVVIVIALASAYFGAYYSLCEPRLGSSRRLAVKTGDIAEPTGHLAGE